MSSISQQNDSEDEFESADEGESIPTPVVKSITPPPINEIKPQTKPVPPLVNDGWGDWNIDDEPIIIDKSIEAVNRILSQHDSASSLSSSPSKTGGSLSQNGSDEDDQNESTDQQRLQRKKFRKKTIETNLVKDENKINTRISRRDEESSTTATIVTKHNVKDAHHVLDRLAAQSPTRTVC